MASGVPSLDLPAIHALKLDDDDDASFVILSEEPSMTEDFVDNEFPLLEQPRSLIPAKIEECKTNDLVKDLEEAKNDLSLVNTNGSFDETHEQLQGLIDENIKLKQTIQQTNAAMEKQHATILVWKKDVTDVLTMYKNKIREAEEAQQINNLINGKLQLDVEKYRKIKELQDEEILVLKLKLQELLNKRADSGSFVHMVVNEETQITSGGDCNEIGDLKKKIDTLEERNSSMESEIEKKYLSKIDTLEKEVEKLQKVVVANQKDYEADLSKYIAENRLYRDQSDGFAREINLKDVKITKLEKEVEELKKVVEANENYGADLSMYINENKLFREQSAGFAREINLKDVKITKLQNEVDLHMKNAESLNVLRSKVQERLQVANEQLNSAQQLIIQLKEDKDALNNELLKKDGELAKKSEEHFVLMEQINLFKSDFEAERETRKTVEAQKSQVSDDLVNIQRRNQQLQAEIDVLREGNSRGFVVTRNENAGASAPNAENTKYVCPKCDFSFSTHQAAINHVERCLELNLF